MLTQKIAQLTGGIHTFISQLRGRTSQGVHDTVHSGLTFAKDDYLCLGNISDAKISILEESFSQEGCILNLIDNTYMYRNQVFFIEELENIDGDLLAHLCRICENFGDLASSCSYINECIRVSINKPKGLLLHCRNSGELSKVITHKNLEDIAGIEVIQHLLRSFTDVMTCLDTHILRFSRYHPNLMKAILDIYEIATISDLQKVAQNKHIEELLKYGGLSYEHLELFQTFLSNDKIREIFTDSHTRNTTLRTIISVCKIENLRALIQGKNIQSLDDMDEVLKEGKLHHLLAAMIQSNPEDVENILGTSIGEDSLSTDYIVLNPKLKAEKCSKCEKYNEQILRGKNTNYTGIYLGDQIIGYIKDKGAGYWNMLGLQDVYDENGILMVKKGFVYAVLNAREHNTKSELYLGEEESISINPVRAISYRHVNLPPANSPEYFDQLIDGFLERYR